MALPRRHRARALLAGAITATGIAVLVVKVTRIGDVIAVVDAGRGWGIHVGDLAAVPLLTIAAACLTECVREARRAARRSQRA